MLHLAWVAVKKDGSILTGHCKCMAGYVLFSQTDKVT